MSARRDFLIGVVIGSAIGAAAALLYAPQAGADTRQQIKEKTSEALDRTADLAQQARERVVEKTSELAQQAQSKVAEVTGRVKSQATDLTSQAHEVVDRARQVIEHTRSAGLLGDSTTDPPPPSQRA
jgi:gas vesicle protein